MLRAKGSAPGGNDSAIILCCDRWSEMACISKHLVRLLCVRRALGHDDKAAAAGAASHGSDVEALLPLGHDPLLGQELIAQVIHLD